MWESRNQGGQELVRLGKECFSKNFQRHAF